MCRAWRAWAVVGAVAVACAPSRDPGVPPVPLAQDAFVWQRAWTPAVRAAVSGAGADVSADAADIRRLLVLVEEVEWTADGASVPRPSEADLDALRGRPVGLAVRVGLPPSGWGAVVMRAARDAVARARVRAVASGVEVAEIHLDIDVPTARLDAYAAALPDVRAAWPGVPLTITGLPDWLRSAALPKVLAAVDGWVLQVHWLRRAGEQLMLMDAAETDAAVSAASALGVPFRVALPTYAQGGVRADPVSLAGRVAGWRAAPPPHMEGIAWFRLPVEGMLDTWPAAAFAAVRGGRSPRVGARAEAVPSRDHPGTWDVRVVATGEDVWDAPCVRATWAGGRAQAADALRATVRLDAGVARWSAPAPLWPGESRWVGWIRLAPGERIDAVDVVAAGECDREPDDRLGLWSVHDGRTDGSSRPGR